MRSPIVELAEPSTGGPTDQGKESAPRRRVMLARALPPLLVLAVGIGMSTRSGGFEVETWSPAALLCLGLVGVMAFVGVRSPAGIVRLALLVLTAYVALSFLSIAWADVDDIAWQGANLTLFYALVFAAMSLSRLPGVPTAVMVLAFGTGVMLTGLWVVGKGAYGAADPANVILYAGRLSEPTGYPNATAAMFSLALWATLGIALEPACHRLLRAAALGVAGTLAGLDLLCQSRGSTFTLPLVLVAFLVLARRRYIAGAVVGVLGLATALSAPVLLKVFPAETAGERHDALAASLVALVASGVCLAALGLLLPLLERLPEPSLATRRRLRVTGGTVVGVAVVAVLLFASPSTRLGDAWDSFQHSGNPQGSSRFVGLGSNRYDFWRVGLAEFQSHPVIGIGVDNFAVPYLERRRSAEQPLYPHSLWVRVLSQTGIIGAALLAAFFVLAGTAALRPRPGLPRGLVGGMLTAVIAWLFHAQVDWLWEMPALGFAAFALLGLAVGVAEPTPVAVPRSTRGRFVGAVALVASGLLAAVSFGLPWLSARYQLQAVTIWPTDPSRAVALARRAASVDPIADDPHVLAGAMQSRLGNFPAMRDEFATAVERNPHNWYAELELGVAQSVLGDREAARRHLLRARMLNPREQIIRHTLAMIESGRPVEPASIDRAVAASDPT